MKRIQRTAEYGFTLLEMMIVVAIFGILAALSFGALTESHHDSEVRGTANTLAGTIKSARLRAITTGLEHIMIINFRSTANSAVVIGNEPLQNDTWVVFQGNMPFNSVPTLYGDERVLELAGGGLTMASIVSGTPARPLQGLSHLNLRTEKTGYLSDIFEIRNCACETNNCNATCPAPLTSAVEYNLDEGILFQPNGTVTSMLSNNTVLLNFTIYLGVRMRVSGTYAADAAKNAAHDLNRGSRWRIVVYGTTGRVKLLRGWGDVLDMKSTML